MRHDYNLPREWPDMTAEERHVWMTQERCRRQAERQRTGYSRRMEKKAKRDARKRQASPAHVKLDEYR